MDNEQAIILHPDYEKLKSEIHALQNEISILMLDRDDLIYRICKNIKTEYMLKIGALEYKVFEQQCMVLRLKRKIEIIQSKINLQQPIIMVLIELQLDEEYKEYIKKLSNKLSEINAALVRSSYPLLSEEEAQELKKLYANIVKKVHPDLNANIKTETSAKYLSNAINAYKNGDLAALRALTVLVMDMPSDFIITGSFDKMTEQRDNFLMQKESLLNTIERIKASFPYNQKDFLSDENKVQQKINELMRTLEEYKTFYNEFEEKIKTMLK